MNAFEEVRQQAISKADNTLLGPIATVEFLRPAQNRPHLLIQIVIVRLNLSKKRALGQ